MDTWWMHALAGASAGALLWLALRAPLLAWVTLAPLGASVLSGSPVGAGLAGAIAGALAGATGAHFRTLRVLLPRALVVGATSWGAGLAGAAWLLADRDPAWLVVALPTAAVLVTLPKRLLGAPRFVSNPLARTQERCLPVVHTARLGGDLVPTALMGVSSAALALLACQRPPSPLVVLAVTLAAAVLLAALAFGRWSVRAAVRRVEAAESLRVAAVLDDGAGPAEGLADGLWPLRSPERADVEATIARYAPLIERAAREGAQVLALPEVCLRVDAASRERWLAAARGWARAHEVVIVAPYFDESVPTNELSRSSTRAASSRRTRSNTRPRGSSRRAGAARRRGFTSHGWGRA